MRSPVMSALFLFFVLALPVGMTAQTSTTSVRGTVTDKSGAMIAGAKVTLSNPQRGFEWSTTTSPAGAYEFLQLTPATYTLTIEAPGFRKSVQTNVELLVNTPATLNATLQVGQVATQVSVVADVAQDGADENGSAGLGDGGISGTQALLGLRPGLGDVF